MPRQPIRVFILLLALSPPAARAEEPVDLAMMTRIRDEGLHHSQVMDTLFHLTDVIGPRLTGSPQLKEANDWTRRRFEEWGLANAHLEGYRFGRGWTFTACEARMVAPRVSLLFALPKAWSPGTDGPVRGEAMRVKLESEKDFDAYRGKLAGKVLLLDDAREFKEPEDPQFERFSDERLGKVEEFDIPGEPGGSPASSDGACARRSTSFWRRRKLWPRWRRAPGSMASCG